MTERYPAAIWGKKGNHPSGTPEPYELIDCSRDFDWNELLRDIVGKFEWTSNSQTPHPDAFVVSPVSNLPSLALVVRLRDMGADSMRRPHTLQAEAVCVSLPASPPDAARMLAEFLEPAAWDSPQIGVSQEGRALLPQPAEQTRINAIHQIFTAAAAPATLFVSAVGNRDCLLPPDWIAITDAGVRIIPQTGMHHQTLSGANRPAESAPRAKSSRLPPKRRGANNRFICVVILLLVGAGAWCRWLSNSVVPDPEMSPDLKSLVTSLAKLLEMPLSKPPKDIEIENLAQNLEDRLFGGPINSSPTGKNDVSRKSTLHPGVDHLLHVIQTFGEAVDNSNTDFSKHEERLKKLFSGSDREFNPTGLLKEDGQKMLNGMSPQVLWPVIVRFHSLKKSVQEANKDVVGGIYGEFFKQVMLLRVTLPPAGPTIDQNVPQRQFFVQDDVDFFQQLSELLNGPSAVDLGIESKQTDLKRKLRDVAAADKLRSLKLKTMIPDFPKNQHEFESLIEFVAACRKAAEIKD